MPEADDLTLRMRATGARGAAREVDRPTAAVRSLRKELRSTGRDAKGATGQVRLFSGGLRPFVRLTTGATAALGILGLGGAARSALTEFREARVVGRSTAAVIKSTGGAANVTADHIARLSNHLSLVAGIDDEVIQKGANMLLTFRNIRNETGKGNDIFNQATNVLTDFSTMVGGSLSSNAIKLGKALNDPVKGVNALSRVGVTFSQTQKDMIKDLVESGDRMGAQKIILRELRKEFGGQAAAAADPINKMQVAWKNLLEMLGGLVWPAFEKGANAAAKFIDQIQTGTGAGGKFRDQVVKAAQHVKDLATFLWRNRTALEALTAAVVAGVIAFKAYMFISRVLLMIRIGIVLFKAWRAGTLAMTAAQLGLNVAMIANPIGLVVVAIVALAAGLFVLYKKSETFRHAVGILWDVLRHTPLGYLIGLMIKLGGAVWDARDKIKSAFVGLWDGLKTGLVATINWVIDKVNWLIDRFNGSLGKVPGVPEIGRLSPINVKPAVPPGGAPPGGPPTAPGAAAPSTRGGATSRRARPGSRTRQAAAPLFAGGGSDVVVPVTLMMPNGDVLAKTTVRAGKKKKATR